MKTNQKNRIFMIGGDRFLTPPDRQETNVSSWSHDQPCIVFMIVKLQLATKRDRQETNVSSWSGGVVFWPPLIVKILPQVIFP